MFWSRPNASFAVAEGVFGFRTVMVNFFIVRIWSGKPDWVLVDAGLGKAGPRIAHEASKLMSAAHPPRAVVLTHGHFDHVGALPWIMERWKVPVYAHAQELPYLNQRQPYAPPDPSVGGGLMARSAPLYPRKTPSLPGPVYPLQNDGSVPGMPDWRWIATPGHSPGHVSFWRERDRTLLSGDAIINTRQESAIAVLKQRQEIRPPPAYFTTDWSLAYQSMLALRALSPDVLAAGHGLPARGPALKKQLDELLNNFATEGVPRRGRYVRETWREPAR
jgi:glyoxylase-like metal-dependent hydrolase (beta-lactamase superfamily II)